MKISSLTKRAALLLVGLAAATSAQAWQTYAIANLSDVTFVGNDVLISIDGAIPGNCAGATTSWLKISGDQKPMAAWVIGLWLRGDLVGTRVTVYTDLVDAGGYCTIYQLDPMYN